MSGKLPAGALIAGVMLCCAGCGGGGGVMSPPPPPPPATTVAQASPSGDGQSGNVGAVLPNPLRVLVSRNASPVAGVTVAWQIDPSEGSVGPTASVSGADGVAATTVTLPPFAATSTITGNVTGATGSPVNFTATSGPPGTAVTVNVVNFEFHPDNFTIKQGGTVSFVWGAGAGPHTVTPVAPNTVPLIPGDPTARTAPFNFDAVFPATGTYGYFCRVHGSPTSGMRGTLTVVP